MNNDLSITADQKIKELNKIKNEFDDLQSQKDVILDQYSNEQVEENYQETKVELDKEKEIKVKNQENIYEKISS